MSRVDALDLLWKCFVALYHEQANQIDYKKEIVDIKKQVREFGSHLAPLFLWAGTPLPHGAILHEWESWVNFDAKGSGSIWNEDESWICTIERLHKLFLPITL